MSLWKKVLCFLGWHEWSWLLSSVDGITLDGPPPPHAKCQYCGVRYDWSKIRCLFDGDINYILMWINKTGIQNAHEFYEGSTGLLIHYKNARSVIEVGDMIAYDPETKELFVVYNDALSKK